MKITKQGLHPHLPEFIFKVSDYLFLKKVPAQIILVLFGLLSTTWFLIRVIPKPSRAMYPCMRATYPFMSGFITYLLGLATTILASKKIILMK